MHTGTYDVCLCKSNQAAVAAIVLDYPLTAWRLQEECTDDDAMLDVVNIYDGFFESTSQSLVGDTEGNLGPIIAQIAKMKPAGSFK